MASKNVGVGAALAVLTAAFGLFILVGLILWMMWMQPGIEHSPNEHSRLEVPRILAAHVSGDADQSPPRLACS